MAGYPIDNQTAGAMLAKIEERHGKAERPCFMDRGILNEAVLLEHATQRANFMDWPKATPVLARSAAGSSGGLKNTRSTARNFPVGISAFTLCAVRK